MSAHSKGTLTEATRCLSAYEGTTSSASEAGKNRMHYVVRHTEPIQIPISMKLGGRVVDTTQQDCLHDNPMISYDNCISYDLLHFL